MMNAILRHIIVATLNSAPKMKYIGDMAIRKVGGRSVIYVA